jgi:bifunctional pyridoxal-dependent enzyme with beta-cystathionase and maltose regulon repressor activities
MFIWVDLRRYVTGAGEVANLSIHHLTPQDKDEYQRREMELGTRFFANGVGVAVGTNFASEELGWFRLTFSVSREALETGLQRMWKVLQEIEQAGWN